MNGAYEVGSAALRAEQRALEILANNIANVNTPGFKRSELQFAEVLAEKAENPNAAASPDNPVVGGGVRVIPRDMMFAQGAIRSTGNPLDVAVDGPGYIELMGSNGQSLFWRGGRLRINEDGYLATESGIALRAAIIAPSDLTGLSISTTGVVVAETGNGENFELGQIGLVRFEHESAMVRLDGGVMRLADGARPIDLVAGEDGGGRIIQGSVEESNVELTQEMVQLMVVQRAYAANAQTIQAADQLAAIANNLKR